MSLLPLKFLNLISLARNHFSHKLYLASSGHLTHNSLNSLLAAGSIRKEMDSIIIITSRANWPVAGFNLTSTDSNNYFYFNCGY